MSISIDRVSGHVSGLELDRVGAGTDTREQSRQLREARERKLSLPEIPVTARATRRTKVVRVATLGVRSDTAGQREFYSSADLSHHSSLASLPVRKSHRAASSCRFADGDETAGVGRARATRDDRSHSPAEAGLQILGAIGDAPSPGRCQLPDAVLGRLQQVVRFLVVHFEVPLVGVEP